MSGNTRTLSTLRAFTSYAVSNQDALQCASALRGLWEGDMSQLTLAEVRQALSQIVSATFVRQITDTTHPLIPRPFAVLGVSYGAE